ncbi:MAG: NADH-quinone oxidoreductase subunit A [Candidatus Micrarchaeaceae archaeon]
MGTPITYAYVYLLFFTVFSIAIPSLFLLASKLMRENYTGNKVKNAPYESGEETIGKLGAVDNEYFPFIMLFLPLEIIAVLVLFFAAGIYLESFNFGLGVILLVVLGFVFAMAGYVLINSYDRKGNRDGRE